VSLRRAQQRDRIGPVTRSWLPSRLSLPLSQHRSDGLSNKLYTNSDKIIAATANMISARARSKSAEFETPQSLNSLYTAEERRRRDATKWTLVQGILAPVQFAVFLVSLVLVIRYLATGEGLALAAASIVIKTSLLYVIMITGSIWEKEVFGCYLFAPAFFWEDVFSFLVLALHSAYLGALLLDLGSPREQMLIALAGYAAYVINATQFVLKLRAARRDERAASMIAVSSLSRDSS
jgi:3-vinyl bacteriochlorophyllide hydratase